MFKFLLMLSIITPSITYSQLITTFAGGGILSSDGIPSVFADIYDPSDIIFDKYGNFYFSVTLSHVVKKIDTNGIITTIAGIGSSGYNGDGIPANTAKLYNPCGLASDTLGNLYISDAGNHRIRKINVTTGIITTIAGTGIPSYGGDNGLATVAMLNYPYDIVFDKFCNLYISDPDNYRIRKINTSGIITTYAGIGTYGNGGDGGLATAAQFIHLKHLKIDTTGNLYLCDELRVRKINTFGIINTIAGDTLSTVYNGDGIIAVNANMNPIGIAIKQKEFYISDNYNNRVRKADSLGIAHTIAGNGIAGYSGDGGLATSASIWGPRDVTFDNCGNLYVSDLSNSRIRKVWLGTTTIPAVAVSGDSTPCAGVPTTYTATATNGGSTPAYSWYKNGVAVAGATGSTYTYIPVSGDSVQCILHSSIACAGTALSNAIHITTIPTVTPVITVTAPAAALVGSTVTVNATVSGAGSSYNITWIDNGAIFNTTTVPTVTYTKATGTDSISAWVLSTSPTGCYEKGFSDTAIVNVDESVNNITGNGGVYVYPNPANDVLNIKTVTNLTYSIQNMLGSTILQGVLEKGSNSVSLQGLASGVYVLVLKDKESNRNIIKLVKE